MLGYRKFLSYSKKLCIVRQVYGPRNKDLIAPGVRPTKKAHLRSFCLQVYGPPGVRPLSGVGPYQVYGPPGVRPSRCTALQVYGPPGVRPGRCTAITRCTALQVYGPPGVRPGRCTALTRCTAQANLGYLKILSPNTPFLTI